MKNKRQKRTILIDLDGVLNTYTGQYDKNTIEEAREGTIEFIKELSIDFDLKLFTTRPQKLVEKWLNKYNMQDYFSEITNTKKIAWLILDDRCIKFDGNYKNTITQIKNFKPWYKS